MCIRDRNTINALSADILNDLLQTSDGGYIVGGSSISLAGYDKSESRIGPSTFNDYWIIKLDLEGSIVWENTIGGNKADDFKSLQECVDGGYILAGSSLSEIYEDKIEANWNSGTYDWWVVKLFSDIEACDVPEGLFTDNITSTSAKIHWNLIPAAENYKVYYRIEGAASWIKKNAFTNFKNLLGLAASTTYEYKIKSYCGIESSSFSDIENFTTLPLREIDLIDHSGLFFLYPNPTSGQVTIESNSEVYFNVYITDILGNSISQIFMIKDSVEFNLNNLSPGVYFITIQFTDGYITDKLIII